MSSSPGRLIQALLSTPYFKDSLATSIEAPPRWTFHPPTDAHPLGSLSLTHPAPLPGSVLEDASPASFQTVLAEVRERWTSNLVVVDKRSGLMDAFRSTKKENVEIRGQLLDLLQAIDTSAVFLFMLGKILRVAQPEGGMPPIQGAADLAYRYPADDVCLLRMGAFLNHLIQEVKLKTEAIQNLIQKLNTRVIAEVWAATMQSTSGQNIHPERQRWLAFLVHSGGFRDVEHEDEDEPQTGQALARDGLVRALDDFQQFTAQEQCTDAGHALDFLEEDEVLVSLKELADVMQSDRFRDRFAIKSKRSLPVFGEDAVRDRASGRSMAAAPHAANSSMLKPAAAPPVWKTNNFISDFI